MLKSTLGWRLLAQLSPDANDGGTPSAPPDDNGQDSSPEQQAEEQSEEGSGEESTEESEEPATEEPGEETPEEQTETAEGEEQEEEQPAPEPPVIDKPEDKDIPFNNHPRFKELVTEKNRYKQEVETVKPLVEQARVTNEFLAQHQITPQEYQQALKYLQCLRTDPQAAYQMLKPTFQQLALLAGEQLTPELQAEVASGTLTAERAAQIVKAEAQQRYQQWRQGQQGQSAMQATQQLVQQTIGSWITTRQGQDPDFKEGSDLWNLTDKNIKAMPVFQTPQQAMAGVEQAYNEAKALLSKFQPKVAPKIVKRPPQSRKPGTTQGVVMKTAEDVAKAIRAGVKPAQMRY